MVAWSLKCISKLHFFMNFKNFDKIYMAHLHLIIFISSESSFQALQSNRTNFQHIYNFNHFIDFQRSMETKMFG